MTSQIAVESKPFSCPFEICKRDFSSKRNLVDHLRGHHQGSKPHSCLFPGCGKSFLRPAHLQIHTRIHTGEKPFVCEFVGCGKRWNQKSALKQHMRSHTGEKPFACIIEGCNKIFSTSSSCKRHQLTHQKLDSWKKRKELSTYCYDHEEPQQPLKKSMNYHKGSSPSVPWILTPHKDYEFDFGETNHPLRINFKMTLNYIMN